MLSKCFLSALKLMPTIGIVLGQSALADIVEELTIHNMDMECKQQGIVPSFEVETWLSHEFNLDGYADTLGWNQWNLNFGEETGFTRREFGMIENADGEFSNGKISFSGYRETRYDSLFWGRVNLNNDDFPDIVLIKSLLQGTRVLVVEHTVMGLCGVEPSSDPLSYRLCGSVHYGRGLPIQTLNFPWKDGYRDRSYTAATAYQSDQVFFTSLDDDGTQSVVVGSFAAADQVHTYEWDIWKLGEVGFEYSRPCS